jgi:hypothetical protein
MAQISFKHKGRSERYEHVYLCSHNGHEMFRMRIQIDNKKFIKDYHTEREAALAVDHILISHRLEPKNILKRL